MSQLEIAKREIVQLSQNDLAQLRLWLNNFELDAWEQQMANDSLTGKLDAFIAQARAENIN